jgi:hypothetical protein
MRSFEFVLGRKEEHWLVHTVSGLLIASGSPNSEPSQRQQQSAQPVELASPPPRHLR